MVDLVDQAAAVARREEVELLIAGQFEEVAGQVVSRVLVGAVVGDDMRLGANDRARQLDIERFGDLVRDDEDGLAGPDAAPAAEGEVNEDVCVALERLLWGCVGDVANLPNGRRRTPVGQISAENAR